MKPCFDNNLGCIHDGRDMQRQLNVSLDGPKRVLNKFYPKEPELQLKRARTMRSLKP